MVYIPQETVEAILLTQPVGLCQLMLRMSEHLRGEVRALFPMLSPAEHLAVCEMVANMMHESVEKARLETLWRDDD